MPEWKQVNRNIILPGIPVSQGRPRVLRSGITYNPKDKEIRKAKDLIRLFWNAEPLDRPIDIILLFEMPIPKSLSRKKALDIELTPHLVRPDIDNLIKFILDACNGIIFRDDSLIFRLYTEKFYSSDPKTTIRIEYNQEAA